MKILRPGYKYEIDSFEGGKSQVIQFIEKTLIEKDGDLITINDGTTNEEVIKVLIDRIKHLNTKFECWENVQAATKLYEALFWLEQRTKDRIERNVDGKHEY